ncbi:MAG: AAA family ATPase [Rhizomicrobium sp.]
MTARIVLLNGVGSAGKSSIARQIQAQARDVFLHVPMDAWLDMMPQRTLGTPAGLTFETVEQDGAPSVIVTSGPELERTLRGMRHAVAAMAAQGCNMVVDDVIFDAAVMDEYRAFLAAHDLRTVGVFAPLDVLEARERARGDRAIGLARGQFGMVHRGVVYDLAIDTGRASPEACAATIVQRFGL